MGMDKKIKKLEEIADRELEERSGGATVAERSKSRKKLKPPSFYKVILLNDDYTPMEFVVFVLQEVFGKRSEDAVRIMTFVHEKGRGVAGTYSYQIAEQKVYDTMMIAQQNEFPLQAIFEEV
jgi:ATP-dependent Clp protease adaptor protein ClpS